MVNYKALNTIINLEEAPLSMRSNNPVTGEENKLLVIHNSTNNNRSFFIILLR